MWILVVSKKNWAGSEDTQSKFILLRRINTDLLQLSDVLCCLWVHTPAARPGVSEWQYQCRGEGMSGPQGSQSLNSCQSSGSKLILNNVYDFEKSRIIGKVGWSYYIWALAIHSVIHLSMITLQWLIINNPILSIYW